MQFNFSRRLAHANHGPFLSLSIWRKTLLHSPFLRIWKKQRRRNEIVWRHDLLRTLAYSTCHYDYWMIIYWYYSNTNDSTRSTQYLLTQSVWPTCRCEWWVSISLLYHINWCVVSGDIVGIFPKGILIISCSVFAKLQTIPNIQGYPN